MHNKFWFVIAGQYFGRVEQNLSHQRVGHILLNFHRPSQGGILWKESTRETPRMFFPLFHPYLFLLQALSWWHCRTSRRRKLCFLRVPVLQWNKHTTQFNLKKKKGENLKRVILYCEKLSTRQIGFYLLRIWMLNTQCFHHEISEIGIHKRFST